MLRLRVLLADTDTENIRNFRTYIKLAYPDMRIVAELNSPADFRERVKEFAPHLIVADIRFFGPLSFQTIREVNEFFPDVRFIIYGSYNDAEYIQKVMEFGVIDYIFRPVRPADLERSLRRVSDVFDEMEKKRLSHESLVTKYLSNIGLFKDKFLSNLINGNLSSEFEIKSGLNYFDINLTPDYTAMIVRIDHFKKIALALDEQEKQLMVFKILTIINEKIGNGVAFLQNLNEIAVILGASPDIDACVAFGDAVRTDIYQSTNREVTIGIGRKYTSATEICVSYREAEAGLRYRNYVGYNTVIPIHYVEPMNNITYRYPSGKEASLVYSAVIGEYDYCMTLLGDILDALEKSGPLPDNLLSKMVTNIVISINRFASEQNILLGDQFMIFFPTKDIITIKTISDMREYLSGCIRRFSEHVLKLRDDNRRKVVELAVEYIGRKYNQDISVTDISLNAQTTPEFLSNAFLGIKGKKINDHIIDVRIENAKKLMSETKETDENIAALVGYKDIKRFKRDFKNHEGIQTFEFRK